jgi:hypothetical protein
MHMVSDIQAKDTGAISSDHNMTYIILYQFNFCIITK